MTTILIKMESLTKNWKINIIKSSQKVRPPPTVKFLNPPLVMTRTLTLNTNYCRSSNNSLDFTLPILSLGMAVKNCEPISKPKDVKHLLTCNLIKTVNGRFRGTKYASLY